MATETDHGIGEAVAARVERRWAVLSIVIVGVLVGMATFIGIHQATMPQGHVETADPKTLHLSGEFVESNLGSALETYYNPLVRKLRALPFPVVAAVNGVAAGAGANIALACDVVLAARSATFVQAFAKIGLVPDSGGTWFLPRLVGPARARGMALTGDPLPADKAEAWGLIWKMHDDLVLMAEAHRLCVHFTEAPTVALALIKRLLDESWANDLDSQLDLERETQREASLTPDYAEGMRAFFEKRSPAFSGRRS